MSYKVIVSVFVLLTFALYGCSGEDDPVASSATSSSPIHSSALAVATKTPVNGMGELGDYIDPGEIFVTGGVTHLRGVVIEILLDGDLTGVGTFDQNANWNAKGNGNASGPFQFNVQWQGRTGVFEGSFAGRIHNYMLSATFTAHGSGELEGLKWIGTYEGPLGGPFFIYGGYIVEP